MTCTLTSGMKILGFLGIARYRVSTARFDLERRSKETRYSDRRWRFLRTLLEPPSAETARRRTPRGRTPLRPRFGTVRGSDRCPTPWPCRRVRPPIRTPARYVATMDAWSTSSAKTPDPTRKPPVTTMSGGMWRSSTSTSKRTRRSSSACSASARDDARCR